MSAGMKTVLQQIRDNMYGRSGSDYISSVDHREQLALTNALLQCYDLTDVPTVTEPIYHINTFVRLNTSCANCKHSKVFKYIDGSGPILVCLLRLAEFEVVDSVVDDEHLCGNYTAQQADCKCCYGGV